ncbi:ABC transporter permease [Planotetraspora phitsanulokensis]|uniref:Peptide ABC transporter permease n=2 Tax=Planotetraspora phitsanulokensis TaxID=575192 RepID=A0A8J3UJR7_9ACTN|nr:peptide ABC transporter permease [Planotetraspora phitsanulokensis]
MVLGAASLLIFGVIRLIPGDPASILAGPDAGPDTIAAIRHELGLDQSLPAQYAHWLGGVLTWNLGRSYIIGGDISSLLGAGAGNTVLLTSASLVIAVAVAVIAGPLWASTRRPWLEHLLTGVNTLAIALPAFVTGVLLILLLGVLLPVLPSGGVPPDGLLADPTITVQYLLMPATCLALPLAAVLARYLAESLRTEMSQPYVATALAAGVSRRRIVTRHALRNVLPTSLTVLGLQIGTLLGGAVLVETVFAWPGLGQLIEQAIIMRDYPVVQVLLLLSVGVFVVIQLLTDVVHALLDPRIRLGGAR